MTKQSSSAPLLRPLLLLLFLTGLPLIVWAEEPTLTSVECVFKTTTNDKDHDTVVDVTLKRSDDTVVADKGGISGHYNDHSTHHVALQVRGSSKRNEMNGSTLNVHISPNGNDKWEFDLDLELKWSDGSKAQKSFNGNVLTQDDPTMSVAVF